MPSSVEVSCGPPALPLLVVVRAFLEAGAEVLLLAMVFGFGFGLLDRGRICDDDIDHGRRCRLSTMSIVGRCQNQKIRRLQNSQNKKIWKKR